MKNGNIYVYRSPIRNTRGFTLIELLVVVAIIGLLSSIVAVSVSNARDKAMDTQRIETLRQLELQANIALLEKKSIPVVSAIEHGIFAQSESEISSEDNIESIMKYIGLMPEYADAATTPLDMNRNVNFKKLFDSSNSTGQSFFKPGTKIPEDPKCDNVDAATCYRAWYNGESLVIATTLRTKSHSTGKQLQYGVVIGKNSYEALQSSCQYMGYPRFNTAGEITPGQSNPVCTGTIPVSAIQGVTPGLDVVGNSNSGTGYYLSL